MDVGQYTQLWLACSSCRLCMGSAYQSIPLLIAGDKDAPIAFISQNPGEIKPTDVSRHWFARESYRWNMYEHVHTMQTFYDWDFATSSAAQTIAKITGDRDWVTSGHYLWTNSVRCRTEGNTRPDDEMIEACRLYTDMIIENRKAVIVIGDVARQQIFGDKPITYGEIKRTKSFGLITYFKHQVRWSDEDIEHYTQVLDNIKGEITHDT